MCFLETNYETIVMLKPFLFHFRFIIYIYITSFYLRYRHRNGAAQSAVGPSAGTQGFAFVADLAAGTAGVVRRRISAAQDGTEPNTTAYNLLGLVRMYDPQHI